jgi:hypothetical protein
MKTWNFFFSLALVSFLSACTNRVYVQKDENINLANYRTYMWVDTRSDANDKSPRATAYIDINLQNSVNDELRKQGLREVNHNPDMLLTYDILVEKDPEERIHPAPGRAFTRTYYNPFSKQWGTIFYPSQFAGYRPYEMPVKAGVIAISMSDAGTDKLVWQGWTTEQLNYTRLTRDEINKTVRNIFNKFDVASK